MSRSKLVEFIEHFAINEGMFDRAKETMRDVFSPMEDSPEMHERNWVPRTQEEKDKHDADAPARGKHFRAALKKVGAPTDYFPEKRRTDSERHRRKMRKNIRMR